MTVSLFRIASKRRPYKPTAKRQSLLSFTLDTHRYPADEYAVLTVLVNRNIMSGSIAHPL